MRVHYFAIGLLLLVLSGCGESEQASTGVDAAGKVTENAENTTAGGVALWYTFSQVTEGARLYRDNCAVCHGDTAQGDAGWRQIGADGKYPAPPLNGTGHGWHHPLSVLFVTVKNGSPGGQGNMPAWKDTLTDDEIVAAIAWFQSKWPKEIYTAWYQRDQQARGGN